MAAGVPRADGESGHFYFGENRTSVLCADKPVSREGGAVLFLFLSEAFEEAGVVFSVFRIEIFEFSDRCREFGFGGLCHEPLFLAAFESAVTRPWLAGCCAF